VHVNQRRPIWPTVSPPSTTMICPVM
jgi:hypothetical protein